MLDETIRCCSLLDNFVSKYRHLMTLELIKLGDQYVLELRGLLHVDAPSAGASSSSCGSGCISCGPPAKEKETEPWRTAPLETVWRFCPFCGGGFVRQAS